MSELKCGEFTLRGVGSINVILGKNGCGKSTLLRAMDVALQSVGAVKYVTPERGGALNFDGNVESNLQRDGWEREVRRKNRLDNFRQMSVSEFRKLETLVLRRIEKDPVTRSDTDFTFDTTIELINSLLENVKLRRGDNGLFKIDSAKLNGMNVDLLSSGESELVSLAIEVLAFAYGTESDENKLRMNWLLLDEPDVHLHPDLQHRLMDLVAETVKNRSLSIMISTHSTAILSALSEHDDVRVAFMASGDKELNFASVDDTLRAVMPVFGAHPLSNIFNAKPLLLVEGEDDERIWQQAVRSSEGAIKLWPCSVGDVQSLSRYEQVAANIIQSVYDDGRAYSFRDGDGEVTPLEDIGPVIRARLNCYAAENLILTDSVLETMGLDWAEMRNRLSNWIAANSNHKQYGVAAQFRDGGWDRRCSRIKDLRNLLMALAEQTKPWEVVVGQGIARLPGSTADHAEFSLRDFLGPKIVSSLSLG